MRHVILTCKNHPDLRWQCKSIAFDKWQGYNGARHIFYNGAIDGSTPPECSCKSSALVLAPGETMPTSDE